MGRFPEDDFEAEVELAPRRRTTEHHVLLFGALLGLLGLIALCLYLEPDPRGYGTHEQLGLRPCYPMERFDVPCPGCGVTTSVVRLSRGDLLGSLTVQPLGTLLALGAVVFTLWAVVGHRKGRDLWLEVNQLDWTRWGMVSLGVALFSWLYKLGAVRAWF